MFTRNSLLELQNALQDSPIVLLNGARQVGKSTLAETLAQSESADKPIKKSKGPLWGPAQYLTLDDQTTLTAAIFSPESFLQGLPDQVVIDEVQRAPQIFLAIKRRVDQQKKPGQFLLTGSANVMTLPRLADSLAGRMEIHTIWPFSQGEIIGRKESFVDDCFSGQKFRQVSAIDWPELMEKIVIGGYPEALKRKDNKRRRIWFSAYLKAILERDIRELANIEGLQALPHLLQLLAARAGGLLNFADISRTTGISSTTLKRYIALLEAVFLYVPLPAWFRNAEKRLVKSPKIYLNDTGLLSYLRGTDLDQLLSDHMHAGSLLENFVVMELLKQIGWNDTQAKLYHFRTQIGREVDIVIEALGGKLVGIEVKSRGEIYANDFDGLKTLAEIAGKNFIQGIVLYTGHETVYFGRNLVAMPISALWERGIR